MSIRKSIKFYLWNIHALCKVYFYMRGKSRLFINSRTEVVIEGYPRCANTYAVAYFLSANPSLSENLAHHIHYPIQVIKAVSRKLPVVVLIRSPEDAVLSLCVREGYSIDYALEFYIRFYRSLISVKGSILVVDFEEAIYDFSKVIGDLNLKFGTNYSCRSLDGETAIMSKIEMWNRIDSGGRPEKSSAPNQAKNDLKAGLSLKLSSGDYELSMATASKIYRNLIGER